MTAVPPYSASVLYIIKNLTMTSAWITAPTSEGSHLKELPLNSGTSMVSPFFIMDQR